MRKWAIGAVAAIVVVSHGPASAQVKPERPELKLAVGGQNLIPYLPLTVAERMGYFKQQGLNVEINDFAGGSRALQALVGGSADVVSGAYEHTIFMQAKGQKIKVIALQNDSLGLVIGVHKSRAAAYKGPKDLKGLKVGVTSPGSASTVGLNLFLGKAGLSLNDVSVIGIGAGGRAVTAVRSGQVDAIANFDPVISMLERDGDIVSVLDTRNQKELDELYAGAFAGSTFYVTAGFIEKNPQTLQAFANAIMAALDWIGSASTEQIVDLVPREFYGDDRAVYTTAMAKYRARFSKDGRVTMDMAKNVLRIVSQSDESVASAKIDLAETFDNTFVDKARSSGR